MQDKEVQKSFPKPPRSFRGDIIDPLLVVEDYEETVGIVRRFARDNPDFTEEDLLVRLARNGVVLYGTQAEWDDLFTEMRNQIVDEAAKKKPPAEVTWVIRQLGDLATYTMVETSAVPQEAVEVPIAEIEYRPDASNKTSRLEEGQPPVLASEILLVLNSATEGMLRPKDLSAAVAKRLRVTHDMATRAIDSALSDSLIRKIGSRGTTFITVNNGDLIQNTRTPAAKPEFEVGEESPLTEDELTMVIAILDRLAEGHVTTGVTIKVLEQQLHSSFSRDHFRKLLRLLESHRLVRLDHEAKYGKARKSPRVHLRGQDTKNRWQANREGYIARLRKATIR